MDRNYLREAELHRNITDSQVCDCNRQVNLTYMLAGVLSDAAATMNKSLQDTYTDLRYDNKKLMNELLETSKKLQQLVCKLQDKSILVCDDEAIESHDDSIGYYYAIFMKFVSVIGVDRLYALRAYMLYKLLDRFRHLVYFPNAELRYQYAFKTLEEDIARGYYTEEEVKECLQAVINENRHQENQG